MISCLRLTASHTKTRRCFTRKKKEVHLNYSISGNYCETAKAFDINESTVQVMIDTRPLPDKMKLSRKCNFQGAGWLLAYSIELDDELLKWIFVLKDLHFPVSVMSLQEKVKLVIQPHNPSFNVRRVWFRKCFNWHKLALRAHTSFSQKLPKQLEGVLSKFYEDPARIMRNGKVSTFTSWKHA